MHAATGNPTLPACLPALGCRESMLKLEVIAEGVLNAVVFWFDLHLDDCETLTNGEAGEKSKV
jgi:hypothetical protein